MKRVGIILRIKPEYKEEYKRIHSKIWPELMETERRVGFRNFSLFYRKDGTIFGYLEIDRDFKEAMEELNKTEIHKKWVKMLDKCYVKDDSSKEDPEIEVLEEVHHYD